MNRILGGVVVVSVFLSPVAIAATPTPSPSLDAVLVPPAGTGFVDDPNALSFPEGTFTAPQWAAVAGTNAPQVEDQLHRDGFVTGFARAWFDKAHNHVLIQGVVAFGGAQGAGKLFTSVSANVSGLQYYANSISVAGVAPVLGAHFANKAAPIYSDQVVFTKGNDYFFISVDSQADDIGDVAVTQAKRQFDVAPDYTIPPGQWPENAWTGGFNWSAAAGPVAVIAFVVAALAVVIVVVAIFFLTRQRPAPTLAYAPMSSALQMSPDGNYWWDGASWRDASREAPPTALRSGDGYYWWDGRAWRLVPKPPS